MKRLVVCGALLVAAGAQLTCNQAILTAPPGTTLQVFANPGFIAANGDISVISALVVEPIGTVVPDGTVVQFFTTLGRIEEQGRTNDGVARVNLISDDRSGTATVTAISGGDATSGSTVEVVIGSARPARVQVTADPVRIEAPGFSRIVANVFDENGNPVANVPIIFTVAQDSVNTDPTESMQSRGSPIFTDNNGRATDELLSAREPGQPAKSVTVTATPAGDTTVVGTVQVTIE